MSVWPARWYSPAPVAPPGRFSPARTLARRNFRSDPILRILILVLIFVILAGQMAPWRHMAPTSDLLSGPGANFRPEMPVFVCVISKTVTVRGHNAKRSVKKDDFEA